MEFRQQLRPATTRPTAWAGAILIALALAVLSWQTISVIRASHSTARSSMPTATSIPLSDRNAERQPVPSPRPSGPGGQIGDAPSTP